MTSTSATPQNADLRPKDASTAPAAEPAPASGSTGLLRAAASAGTVRFYRQRANGSTRAIPYLAEGTEGREVAEWVAARTDDGASVATVAEETGLSRATVRRTLAALALTEEVEDGDLDDLYEDGVTEIVLAGDLHEEDE